MPGKTVTRNDLAENLYQELGLSHSDCRNYVNNVITMIADDLVASNEVKISGFGTFSIRQKKERMGRNLKTNEEVPFSARTVLVFKASQILKEQVAVRSK